MSFYDNLTQKALSMGKSSGDFTKAAQENANATWFYGILGGVFWYFFSWLWAIIPFILAIYSAFQSVSATIISDKINEFNPSYDSRRKI